MPIALVLFVLSYFEVDVAYTLNNFCNLKLLGFISLNSNASIFTVSIFNLDNALLLKMK